jgi:glyoxylase-like metal-dependent hydrolase (beta-lactamase superfamily II)
MASCHSERSRLPLRSPASAVRRLGGLFELAVVFFLSAPIATAGLEKYSTLIFADSPDAKQKAGTVRVTYLGVNGYQFEANGHALLVDPYFTRAGLTSIAFEQQLEPNEARISFGLRHVRSRVDAVLVTHAHFDHLLDVPEIMKRTNAPLVRGGDGSESDHVMWARSWSMSCR